MKHIKLYEEFVNEGIDTRENVIELLQKELDWNKPTLTLVNDKHVKMYSTSKNKLTTSNGIVYWGMSGQSLLKDIKEILKKANINANVFRGFQTSMRDDEHDYIIILN